MDELAEIIDLENIDNMNAKEYDNMWAQVEQIQDRTERQQEYSNMQRELENACKFKATRKRLLHGTNGQEVAKRAGKKAISSSESESASSES